MTKLEVRGNFEIKINGFGISVSDNQISIHDYEEKNEFLIFDSESKGHHFKNAMTVTCKRNEL